MSVRELRKLLSDGTERISGTIIEDTGSVFTVSTRYGVTHTPSNSQYKVGDRVYMVKGNIVAKVNGTSTKVFSV